MSVLLIVSGLLALTVAIGRPLAARIVAKPNERRCPPEPLGRRKTFRAKAEQIDSGVGELRYGGFRGNVSYEIKGEPAKLKAGHLRLKGSLTTTPEIAEELFRRGEGVLVLADGKAFRLTMTGHSVGAGVAYFEMRV